MRLDDVDCERRAWERKSDADCNPTVLGLRTELECKLLPNDCVWSATSRVSDICRTDNYKRNGRYMYGDAAALATTRTHLLLSLALCAASRLVLSRA